MLIIKSKNLVKIKQKVNVDKILVLKVEFKIKDMK